jgi:tetratricopeptide (TPR) repeat protein
LTEGVDIIEKLIDQGRYFEARSRAETALAQLQDLRLKQLYALSLSKSGLPEAALQFMEPVYLQFPDDPESAGIMGSICKELFKKNQSNSFAIRSRDTYLKNFSATKNTYTGINAASMSAMAGQLSKGREIAAEVISLLEGKSIDFWALATLGEAYMLTKNNPKSVEYYARARKEAGMDWGKITSVHNQLWLLNHFIPLPNEILKLFKPPGVVAFVGHMIDHPLRQEPRFPASIEHKIKEAIIHSIRSLNVHIGYSSLACGGDILFAEAMAEEGREVNIFLPFQKSDFIRTSVQFAGAQWIDRFNALLERFPVTYLSSEAYGGLDDIFSFQTRIIFGSATLRGESYHDEPYLLTVLSEVDLKRKEGGTRDTIGLWPFAKHHTNINPDIFVKNSTTGSSIAATGTAPERKSVNHPVLYLAYVDLTQLSSSEKEKIIHGFWERRSEGQDSYLNVEPDDSAILVAFGTESGVIEYVRFILGTIATLRNAAPYKISLHAGPVYLEGDENTVNRKMSAVAVKLVKQMNKFTTKGSLFASDDFAALLALKGKMFSIDYGGIIEFPEAERKTTIYKISFTQSH